jgi:hypothetical protein
MDDGECLDSDNDDDSDDDDGAARCERRPAKKRRLSKKNLKAVYKSFQDPPGLTYASVKRELGEEPHVCRRGKTYLHRDDIFDLLFLSRFQPNNALKQGWKNLPHLHALKAVKARLEAEEFEQVVGHMRRFFRKYCLCISAVSKDRWLANSTHSKFKPTWIGFNGDGERMDYPNMPEGYDGEYGSTWHREVSIHEEYCWRLTCDDVTSDEGLR